MDDSLGGFPVYQEEAVIKLEIEHRHSDSGEDAGGYSVLRFNGEWLGRVADSKLAQELIQAVEKLEVDLKTRWEAEQGKTHWEGCWRDHYRCAMTRIEELQDFRKKAARTLCGYCAGTKGHNPQPVKINGEWCHLFKNGNGSNPCAAAALWDLGGEYGTITDRHADH